LQAEDNFFDDYYKKFEDRFRGDELTISKRLKVSYGKFFRELPAHIKKRTVVDVGCGRGELLGLLKAEGLHSIGIDLNAEMVRSAQESGYEAVCTDALEHIGGCADASLGGIVGIHIAEHLPFETLYRLISESRRALARDGFLILETPNPENITVGAHTFWFDSSHIKPLPPQVLAFMVEYAGFSSVTIKRMRPIDARAKIQASVSEPRLATFLNDSMFGPVDYAIIARP
jgi:O-antigen chain-terminating methyltransferase